MPDWLPVPASTYAKDIDGLILLITVIVGIWFVIAEAVLFYLIFRYRRRAGVKPQYVDGSRKKQIAWILIPCAAILACDLVIDADSARVWDEVKQTNPKPDLTVRVDGRQWAWDLTNPGPDRVLDTKDDITLLNELHVPAGEVVRFELRSRDTLHSLWVPELRLKQDAVPGRTFRGWFEATRPGEYGILCAELCGVAHGIMKGKLIVHESGEYRSWLAAHSASALDPAKETP
ncbi:MAG TPA: cytochrome c oxidase subunit II [Candidatus Eisenbacteria bacterium]|nr:cytochrome c oxidase subunit II [Candidatus Eisenbacteria bacterium]